MDRLLSNRAERCKKSKLKCISRCILICTLARSFHWPFIGMFVMTAPNVPTLKNIKSAAVKTPRLWIKSPMTCINAARTLILVFFCSFGTRLCSSAVHNSSTVDDRWLSESEYLPPCAWPWGPVSWLCPCGPWPCVSCSVIPILKPDAIMFHWRDSSKYLSQFRKEKKRKEHFTTSDDF